MKNSNRKTCIVLEEYDQKVIDALSRNIFNIYEHDVTLTINNKQYECYIEYMSGDHILVCGDTVYHHENNMFYVDTKTYIYAGDMEWQVLGIQQTANSIQF